MNSERMKDRQRQTLGRVDQDKGRERVRPALLATISCRMATVPSLIGIMMPIARIEPHHRVAAEAVFGKREARPSRRASSTRNSEDDPVTMRLFWKY